MPGEASPLVWKQALHQCSEFRASPSVWQQLCRRNNGKYSVLRHHYLEFRAHCTFSLYLICMFCMRAEEVVQWFQGLLAIIEPESSEIMKGESMPRSELKSITSYRSYSLPDRQPRGCLLGQSDIRSLVWSTGVGHVWIVPDSGANVCLDCCCMRNQMCCKFVCSSIKYD